VEDDLDNGKTICTVSLADQNLKKNSTYRATTQHVTIDTDVPSVREISDAIRKMKNGKAPGADGISADLPQAEKKSLNSPSFRSFSAKSGYPSTYLKTGRLV